MPPLPRALALVAVSAIVVGGLSACLGDEESFDDQSKHDEKITAVRIDSRTGGDVTLHGGKDNSDVTVRRSVEYHGGKPKGDSHRIEDGVLVLTGCGNDCTVNYTVHLPADLPVSGETSHGALRMSQVGDVDVHTRSGGVTLDQVSGEVRVRTSHGSVKGRALAGKGVDAQTSNGTIDLVSTKAQDVHARTSNGRVKVIVPAGSYTVEASTSNGDKDVKVPNDPRGVHTLRATSGNGDIRLAPAA